MINEDSMALNVVSDKPHLAYHAYVSQCLLIAQKYQHFVYPLVWMTMILRPFILASQGRKSVMSMGGGGNGGGGQQSEQI